MADRRGARAGPRIAFTRSRRIERDGVDVGRIEDTGRYGSDHRWVVHLGKATGRPGRLSSHAMLRDAKDAAAAALAETEPTTLKGAEAEPVHAG